MTTKVWGAFEPVTHVDLNNNFAILTGEASSTASTATGSPTSRAAADRASDTLNVRDFGAVAIGASHPLSALGLPLATVQAMYAPFGVTVASLTQECDWAACQAAVNYAHTVGGAGVYFPHGIYWMGNNSLDLSHNNVSLRGDGRTACVLDFAGQTATVGQPANAGLRIGPNFDWSIRGMTIRNAYGHCVSIANGDVGGDQAGAAHFDLFDVEARGSRTGDGFRFGPCFMGTLNNARSMVNAGRGFNFFGFSTSISAKQSYALMNTLDGWNLQNLVYSSVQSCGSDLNGGYGYRIQDVGGLTLLANGGEQNVKAMHGIVYDSASVSLLPRGVSALTIEGAVSVANNSGASSLGYFADLVSNSFTTPAGNVALRGNTQEGGPTGASVGSIGQWNVTFVPGQGINQQFAGTGFLAVSNGATDASSGLGVNVALGGSVIATLGSSARNGVATYGGKLIVSAANNSLSSGSRAATYELLVSNAITSGQQMILTSSAGNTTGATADSASFTFSLNPANGNLTATPVGSTAAGLFFFQFSALGNLSVVPK